jgi:multidrug efflux pump subunit AcrA (membrane-fusion protein)
MTSDAQLLGGRGDRTLTVPAAALQIMEGDTVVVRASTVGDGLLLEARPVRAGRRTSEQVEILSGVGIGDTVLATGAALGKAEILKRRAGGEGGHDH